MGIFGIDNIKNVETTPVDINKDVSKTPIYATDIEIDAIIKQISGYKWPVDYYNVVVDNEDNVSTPDFDIDNIISEYVRIKDLIIYVDTPIENTNISQVEGSGTVKGMFTPHNGDIFLSRTLDNRIAIFQITGVRYDKYLLNDIYRITYKLYMVIDDDTYKTLLDRLSERVIETLYYNKEYLYKEDKELLTENEYVDRHSIDTMYYNLIDLYNKEVIIPDYDYMLIQDKLKYIYDPRLETFVKKVIGLSKLTDRLKTFTLPIRKAYTIYDIMLNHTLSKKLVKLYFEEIGVTAFGTNPFLAGISYTKISTVLDITDEYIEGIYKDYLPDRDNTILPLLPDNTYLFSKTFYDLLFSNVNIDDVTVSLLETLVLTSVNNEPIKLSDIQTVYQYLVENPDRNDLLLYVPVVVYLLKYYKASSVAGIL